jgi:membrane-associated phospholipid phosphatase
LAVNPPERTFGSPWPAFQRRLEQSTSALPPVSDFMKGAGVAAGTIAVAALNDKPVDRFASNHADSRVSRGLDSFGKAFPVAMIGAAGMAVAFGDKRMENTGIVSLQSALMAAGTSIGTKYIVNRARPEEGRGRWAQSTNRSDASFPSNHASVAFAAVTPFAKEYDAPWLYGLAAAGSMGRVAARKHWFSDVVAGGLLGYATGSWFWGVQRDSSKSAILFSTGPGEVAMTWQKSY